MSTPAFNLSSPTTSLRCSGCGCEVPSGIKPVFKCPNCASLAGGDHVLMPVNPTKAELKALSMNATTSSASKSSFVKYRSLLFPYRVAVSLGMTDSDYVALVTSLDDAISAVDGTGFHSTPATLDEQYNAVCKNESGSVAQSHKARHLFNLMT